MAELPEVFNAEEAEDASFKALPEGWYFAQIIKSELKTTKKGGKMISFQFRITEGEFAKRIVFANLNIVNDNENAVRMAKSDLKKICEALGVETVVDTEELHNQDLQIFLKIRPATANYAETNDIKDYADMDFVPPEDDGADPFDD